MSALSLHASQIVPGLWVSGMPRSDWDLVAEGVDLVISLSEHLPPQAARRFEWHTRGGAAGNGRIVYAHWPIEDGPAPDMVRAQLVAGLASAGVAAGMTVLVHCQEGQNRSGLVAALAVRLMVGCSGQDAVALVRQARRGALRNTAFAAVVQALPAPG